MSGSTSGIISNLPCNVLDKILMCLTLQDAARTSVLSRKWRYSWTKLPQLVFNDWFYNGSIGATTNQLMMIIHNVLLLHNGPILKFTLSLWVLESCPEINQLIYFVSNNGIKEFTLHIWSGEPYKLPSSLFSCLQLEDLDLFQCEFKPPPGFKGFNGLVSLKLGDVFITDDALSSLISSCPLLERMKIESSTTIDYLEIFAPNLRFLSFGGLLRSICFKHAPHLAKVTIRLRRMYMYGLVSEDGDTSKPVMLLGSLPVIEVLELDYFYAKSMAAGGVSERFPTTWTNLKILELYFFCFGELDVISIVLSLMRSSPNLEKLKIVASLSETAALDPVLEMLEVDGRSDFSLNQLRKLEMENVSGTSPELEFIKFLLSKSPMLETVLIRSDSNEVCEKSRISEEVARFRGSSPQAEITVKTQYEA